MTLADLPDLDAPWVAMMIGVPGSGKSTIANKIGQIMGVEVLSSDKMREIISGDANNQQVSANAWQMVYDSAAELLANNKSVIIDGTHADAQDRMRGATMYRDFGAAAVIAVWVMTDMCAVLQRNAKRKRVVPADVIERMAQSITAHPPTLADGFDDLIVIDNSGAEPQ